MRQNAGRVLVGVIDTEPVEDVIFSSVDFVDCNLSSTEFRRCELHDVTLRGVDLTGARFFGCPGQDVRMESIVMDPNTLLGIDGVQLGDMAGLITFTADGRAVACYAPADVQMALLRAGLPAAETAPAIHHVTPAAVALTSSLAHAFERANLLTSKDTPPSCG